MLKTIRVWGAIFLLLSACDSEPRFQESPEGLTYHFFEDKPGREADSGDIVTFHLEIRNNRDSLLESSFRRQEPYAGEVPGEPPFRGSLESAFYMLSPGDSAAFRIPADSLYRNKQYPAYIDSGSKVRYKVKVLNVQPRQAYRDSLQKQHRAGHKRRLQRDLKRIHHHLDSLRIPADTTKNGLVYSIMKEGAGAQPTEGDTVDIYYTGRLLNGEMFDVRQPGNPPMRFVVGQQKVIPAWQQGVPMIKEGGRWRLYVPSPLGYGQRGAGETVPPGAILVFDIHLEEVR